jgi:PST family polysaccharide transporter
VVRQFISLEKSVINHILASIRKRDQRRIFGLSALDLVTWGWLIILVGTGARTGLSFLTGVSIARTFGPADFGVYALLTAVVGITGVITNFGLAEAAVKNIAANWRGARRQALRQAQVYFWLRVGLAAVGILTGVLFARFASQHLVRLPDDGTLFFLALLGMGATALSGSVNVMLQGTSRFGKIAVVLVLSSGFGLAVAVLLALAGQLTLVTAMLGTVVGIALAAFLVGYRLLPRNWGGNASPLSFPGRIALRTTRPPGRRRSLTSPSVSLSTIAMTGCILFIQAGAAVYGGIDLKTVDRCS